MKKRFSLFLGSVLLSTTLLLPQSTAHAQDDITGIALETDMRAMVEQGIINGYGDGVYKPGENVTRGQFATFISRALKLPEGPAVFNDVPLSSGLAKGINSASAVGILSGYTKTTFGPNDPITREQVAAMVDRALIFLQVERTEAPLDFVDTGSINPNFKQAVARNVNDVIIKGLKYPDGTTRFLPQKTATRAEAAAFISRMLNKAKEEELPEPPPGEPIGTGFKIATISNGELVYGTKSYTTFDGAKSAITNISNQVVTLDEQIVKMGAGIVLSKPSVGQSITYIYSNESLTSSVTYLPAHQEMKYIDSTDTYVKVNIAGMTAYVKHNEVSLIPLQLIEGRNYYSANSYGELVHSIYNPMTKTYASYTMGSAPSFFATGNQYYSWDGGVFSNTSGTTVGTAYSYFNYLPARTKTNYTAEELNLYIDNKLSEIEGYYLSNPTTYARYKDATKISKLKGLGTSLKEAETKHKINALLILGMAMHESDYGMSKYSLERNNLFGLKAYDSNTDAAETFATPGLAIDALATRYLNANYIPPTGKYFNGAVTGNKSRGFNMKYASDPYWGQKIAGHMYRVDKFLGKKDSGFYKIGETNQPSVNVRLNVGTSSTLIFEYVKSRQPVAIQASVPHTDGYNWLNVISDSISYDQAFIRSDLVTEMKFAQ